MCLLSDQIEMIDNSNKTLTYTEFLHKPNFTNLKCFIVQALGPALEGQLSAQLRQVRAFLASRDKLKQTGRNLGRVLNFTL